MQVKALVIPQGIIQLITNTEFHRTLIGFVVSWRLLSSLIMYDSVQADYIASNDMRRCEVQQRPYLCNHQVCREIFVVFIKIALHILKVITHCIYLN